MQPASWRIPYPATIRLPYDSPVVVQAMLLCCQRCSLLDAQTDSPAQAAKPAATGMPNARGMLALENGMMNNGIQALE